MRTVAIAVRRFVGVLLLFIGLAATIIAVPATFFAIGLVVGADYEGLSTRALLQVWAASTGVAVAGVVTGLALERRGRGVVLFLRRFGDIEATSVVSYAATRAVGASFRLVTLADSSIRPLGAGGAMSRAVTVASKVWRRFGKLSVFLVERFVPRAIAVAIVTGGIAYAATRDVTSLIDVVTSLLSGRVPWEAMAFSALGMFAVAATVAALGLVALFVVFVTMLLRFPLAAVMVMAGSTGRAVDDAERKNLIRVDGEPDIARAVAEVAGRSGKVFAPRLVVLRVATPVWRETVRRLAGVAEVMLIDVSEPSENLLWEVERMTSGFGTRCVFTCHRSSVPLLTDASPADPVVDKLRSLLGAGPILAYSEDRAGMRRFARALRARMLKVAR